MAYARSLQHGVTVSLSRRLHWFHFCGVTLGGLKKKKKKLAEHRIVIDSHTHTHTHTAPQRRVARVVSVLLGSGKKTKRTSTRVFNSQVVVSNSKLHSAEPKR